MHRGNPNLQGCLKFSDIKRSVNNPTATELSYHLSKLVESDLVDKIAYRDDKNRVYPLYKVGEKWMNFARKTKFDETLKTHIREKYPDKFIEN